MSPLSDDSTPPSLEALPDELLQLIASYLSPSDLKSLSLVSKCTHPHATALLWRNVSLIDSWKCHVREGTCQMWSDRGQGESDEHDDTAIIQKLYILAMNPFVASKVQVFTHRCHLPTPGIFSELRRLYFHSPYLSRDARTLKLLQLAIRNMVNVHTLRIVFGHHNLTKGLLEGFLDPTRPRCVPLRKLWLESCCLLHIPIDFGSSYNLSGLESLRVRRMRADREIDFRLARGGLSFNLHDAAGGFYSTTVDFPVSDALHPRIRPLSAEELNAKAEEFDALIWSALPEVEHFVSENHVSPQISSRCPSMPLANLFEMSSSTLTKLNLDWIMWRDGDVDPENHHLALATLFRLSQLRFPNLRSFQLRNAVISYTVLPPDLYLLEPGAFGAPVFLDFLEAHPKLQCLGWPLDRFYSHTRPSAGIITRSRNLVDHLGRVLIDLRLDSYYDSDGEPQTDEDPSQLSFQARIRRRRFISEFAPFMTRVEQIKLEGGIPRDEKREIIRALHFCPLKKIVLIGVSFPVGNTWGFNGEDLKQFYEGEPNPILNNPHMFDENLEEEEKAAIFSTYAMLPSTPEDFKFTPSYGWPPSPPFLHTIAAHHASTVTELKLCGYNGSPWLSYGTPITKPLLYPLRYFHNLRRLVISMWLFTVFEGTARDPEIIQSWKDTRSSSTALVVITPAASSPSPSSPEHPIVAPTTAPATPNPVVRRQEFNRWAVLLKTRYTPSALAYRVAADIGPHLSPVAKERKGGVRVRASFCLGERHAHDIFDLDIRIGRDDQVLEFVGPREEGEKGRWWDKLEGRRWF
ncbi:hypothetical protein K469DRAFT_731095 [Zopfia rhizophila CBS 207.26]|uniref:F-box domain-containing protein n=1 Tax=Zopfia rhizophila CBS 207.26 TaxID=1314779 RepID=A0A6A6EKC5_9PEZI|nr:hypothetical protein K469DRAFT_731095 [Zopfia rhizophila CBS 207.26]